MNGAFVAFLFEGAVLLALESENFKLLGCCLQIHQMLVM